MVNNTYIDLTTFLLFLGDEGLLVDIYYKMTLDNITLLYISCYINILYCITLVFLEYYILIFNY